MCLNVNTSTKCYSAVYKKYRQIHVIVIVRPLGMCVCLLVYVCDTLACKLQKVCGGWSSHLVCGCTLLGTRNKLATWFCYFHLKSNYLKRFVNIITQRYILDWSSYLVCWFPFCWVKEQCWNWGRSKVKVCQYCKHNN